MEFASRFVMMGSLYFRRNVSSTLPKCVRTEDTRLPFDNNHIPSTSTATHLKKLIFREVKHCYMDLITTNSTEDGDGEDINRGGLMVALLVVVVIVVAVCLFSFSSVCDIFWYVLGVRRFVFQHFCGAILLVLCSRPLHCITCLVWTAFRIRAMPGEWKS